MVRVSIQEAKKCFSKLLERAHTGEEIVITKRGVPYARLASLQPRAPGLIRGKVDPGFFEPLSDEELEAWSAE